MFNTSDNCIKIMKINNKFVNTSNFFLLIFIISSCGSEIKRYNLTLYANGQIFEDSIQLNNSKALTESIPKIMVNDQIYICDDVKFMRIDRPNETATLRIEHNLANNVKLKMGIELSAEDKLNDIAEASNIHFPALFSEINGTSKSNFPSECNIIIQSIDSLSSFLSKALSNDSNKIDIHIGIDTKHSLVQTTLDEPNPIARKKSEESILIRETEQIRDPQAPSLPNLKLNLEISDDQSELKWHNNEKNGSSVRYTITIYKNNQPIITKSNIHGNKISCLDLNNNKVLNVDCEYLIQITASRKEDNTELTETYDIELTSPVKFNPRCHLNLQND